MCKSDVEMNYSVFSVLMRTSVNTNRVTAQQTLYIDFNNLNTLKNHKSDPQ